jgi:hypothetical protein
MGGMSGMSGMSGISGISGMGGMGGMGGIRGAPPKLCVAVSYCSNERPFVRALLRNALLFADSVAVAAGSRLYSGEPEAEDHLIHLALEFPQVRFVRYDVPDALLPRPIELHNAARKAAVAAALLGVQSPDDAWVLLLDGDEVPDGPAAGAWWRATRGVLLPDTAYKMANRWYFLDARLVAEATEDSVLLVHASKLTSDALSHPRERDGVLLHHGVDRLRTMRQVPGLGGRPLFHHYSWVREDRDALLRKVANWGHSGDRPWATLLQEQMDEVDAGRVPATDFVHGHALHLLDEPAFEELRELPAQSSL